MNKSLLSFPCEFPIKVFGHANEEFESAVVMIIRKHITDLKEGAIQIKSSKHGHYRSITITISVETKEQLDAIYQDLTACDRVLMAL